MLVNVKNSFSPLVISFRPWKHRKTNRIFLICCLLYNRLKKHPKTKPNINLSSLAQQKSDLTVWWVKEKIMWLICCPKHSSDLNTVKNLGQISIQNLSDCALILHQHKKRDSLLKNGVHVSKIAHLPKICPSSLQAVTHTCAFKACTNVLVTSVHAKSNNKNPPFWPCVSFVPVVAVLCTAKC